MPLSWHKCCSREIILVYSKFPKNKISNYSSFDVVFYKGIYYAGFQLFKNFANYLVGDCCLPVTKFDTQFDAERYFDAINF
jgi:hypothetical protein